MRDGAARRCFAKAKWEKKGFRATAMLLCWWRGMEQPAAVLRKRNGKQKRLPGGSNVALLVARDGAAR